MTRWTPLRRLSCRSAVAGRSSCATRIRAVGQAIAIIINAVVADLRGPVAIGIGKAVGIGTINKTVVVVVNAVAAHLPNCTCRRCGTIRVCTIEQPVVVVIQSVAAGNFDKGCLA